MTDNPLSKFMRKPKFYIKIPSNGFYYHNGELELTDNKEIGILPMTAMDEILLNTPDALLNGEGIKKAIESCVPSVKNANDILITDFEVFLLAIRKASHGDEMHFEVDCPKCNKANEYSASIGSLIETIKPLEPPYSIEIEKGLTVFVKPYTFRNITLMALESIESAKVIKSLNLTGEDVDEVDLMEKLKNEYTNSIKRLASIAVESVLDGIDFIEIINENGEKQKVTDQEFIMSWLENLNKKAVDSIQNKINEIPAGFDKSLKVQCEHCNHEWDTKVEINPTDFFELGS